MVIAVDKHDFPVQIRTFHEIPSKNILNLTSSSTHGGGGWQKCIFCVNKNISCSYVQPTCKPPSIGVANNSYARPFSEWFACKPLSTGVCIQARFHKGLHAALVQTSLHRWFHIAPMQAPFQGVLWAASMQAPFHRGLHETQCKPFSEGFPHNLCTSTFSDVFAGSSHASPFQRGLHATPTLPLRVTAGQSPLELHETVIFVLSSVVYRNLSLAAALPPSWIPSSMPLSYSYCLHWNYHRVWALLPMVSWNNAYNTVCTCVVALLLREGKTGHSWQTLGNCHLCPEKKNKKTMRQWDTSINL